ncbi:MAG: sensor histidine kinase [Aminipila sp.]
MNDVNSTLCRRFTNLNEEEIAYLHKYIDRMQKMADDEKADVFIDCKTYTGRTMVIVAESKPTTIKSAYEESLLGMLIKWENEPALDRTFHLKLPTIGVKALLVPNNVNVVQSAYPIIFKDKVIAVLIYEKRIEDDIKNHEDESLALNLNSTTKEDLLEFIRDAVVLINYNNEICYGNRAAVSLFKDLGYVDNLLGMHIGNLWCDYELESDNMKDSTLTISSHTLKGKKIDMGIYGVKYALIIENMTGMLQMEKDINAIKTSYRELKHRIKNSLQLVYSICDEKAWKSDSGEVADAYKDVAGRLRSMLATLDERMVDSYKDEIEIKEIINRIGKDVIRSEASPYISINFSVSGDQIYVSGERAVTIGLIINELIHNALKYAFKGRTEGEISVHIKKDFLCSSIIVEDNGIGFKVGIKNKKSMGLELVNVMVLERLNGQVSIDSSHKGTRIEFDFVE